MMNRMCSGRLSNHEDSFKPLTIGILTIPLADGSHATIFVNANSELVFEWNKQEDREKEIKFMAPVHSTGYVLP